MTKNKNGRASVKTGIKREKKSRTTELLEKRESEKEMRYDERERQEGEKNERTLT